MDGEEIKIWTKIFSKCMGKRKARKVVIQARYTNIPQKDPARKKECQQGPQCLTWMKHPKRHRRDL